MAILKRAINKGGWAGWEGGVLYENPGTLSDEELDAALAETASATTYSVAVIKNTPTNHALRGCSYVPQGYAITPDGPGLSFFGIEGGLLLEQR